MILKVRRACLGVKRFGMEVKMEHTHRQRRKRTGSKKRTEKNRIRNRLLIALGVLIGLFFLGGVSLIAAWLILDHQGRTRLAARQEAVPEGMHQGFEADMEGEEPLRTGELRYQGKTYAYKNDVMTFLIMGIDKTGQMEASEDLYEGGQADALFLMVLDPGEKTIRIVGIDEADPDHGDVSWVSPIARVFLKQREGDQVKLPTPATIDHPARVEVLEVVEVTYTNEKPC